MTICMPLGRGTGGTAYGGFGGHDGMDRLGGDAPGLGIGMSNGGAALGVGRFEFDNASPQYLATSYIYRGDSFYSLPSAGHRNGTNGSGASGGPGGHRTRSAAGASSGVDELLGLFSTFRVGGGASDAPDAPGALRLGSAGVYASRYTIELSLCNNALRKPLLRPPAHIHIRTRVNSNPTPTLYHPHNSGRL